jgi:hypothetical protein
MAEISYFYLFPWLEGNPRLIDAADVMERKSKGRRVTTRTLRYIHFRSTGVAQGSPFKPCGLSRCFVLSPWKVILPNGGVLALRVRHKKIWKRRRVTIRTLRYTNSMSRLRRLQVTGKTFFITCNLLSVRTQLTEADFAALASLCAFALGGDFFSPATSSCRTTGTP